MKRQLKLLIYDCITKKCNGSTNGSLYCNKCKKNKERK